MHYYVYILYSSKLNRFYVGFTKNVDSRLSEHNHGDSSYTSTGIPWSLLWSTVKSTMKDAVELEQKLKNLSRERKIRFMNKYDEGIEDQILLKKISDLVSSYRNTERREDCLSYENIPGKIHKSQSRLPPY